MYERVLDEGQIARDIVDAIRSTTDAPLSSCIEAARSCMAVMAPFIQVEAFSRIQAAVDSYTVKVDDCYDYRLLSEMEERLTPLFKEKYELSYSSEQDDDILVKHLQMFSSCALKTDPQVVTYLISTDDYQLVDHLINIYQMLKTDPQVVTYLISTDDYQLVDHLINIYQMLNVTAAGAPYMSAGLLAYRVYTIPDPTTHSPRARIKTTLYV
ncbi:hypothetical protein OESDEN_05191 [Oesophagostomum dentatum]|uniref:Uncharacterized protein n=1 Tax=Oesophagostomum dentatum TaxID=61180 RepID=A0A0B1THI2_OESDE|nr:hypothetical protein OESDEN_05191 [Oesophagostomum dentatum]